MDRKEDELYSKVLKLTSAFTELTRLMNNHDNSVGTVCKYNTLAHTLTSKITSNNNTKFILVCERSGVEVSIPIGIELKVKRIRISNFKPVYYDTNK